MHISHTSHAFPQWGLRSEFICESMNPDTFLSANPPASYPQKRYYTLDIARAIAIILVAVGHFNIEPMPQFYRYLIDVIYTFHMPLFMFVSGFLCIATMKKTSYMKFISKKFFRLMVPYFVTSVIIIFIKLLTEKVQPVDHPVTVSDFIEILWLPKAGYFLWFVYALWWMMVIVPLFNTARKRMVFLLIAILLFFFNSHFTTMFCLHETARFMIYFASGCVVYDILKKIPVRALCLTSFFAFPVLAVILIINPIAVISQSWLLSQLLILATAFSGIGFTLVVSNALENHAAPKIRHLLFSLSTASYIIYLFHTTFMGFSKAALTKIHFFQSGNLMVHYSVAELIVPLFSGVVLSYLLYKYILTRYNITRKLFGL